MSQQQPKARPVAPARKRDRPGRRFEDVVTAHEADLYRLHTREVRACHDTQVAYERLAARTGRTVESIGAEIEATRAQLRAAGLLASWAHGVTRNADRDLGHQWTSATVAEGSEQHRAMVAAGAVWAQSSRYAANLAYVNNLFDELPDVDVRWVIEHVTAEVDLCNAGGPFPVLDDEIAQVEPGEMLIVSTERDRHALVMFHVPGIPYDQRGDTVHLTAGQAAWVAGRLAGLLAQNPGRDTQPEPEVEPETVPLAA